MGYDVTVKVNNFYSIFIYKNFLENVTVAQDTLEGTRTTHVWRAKVKS